MGRTVLAGATLVLIAASHSSARAGGSYVGDPGGQAAQRAGAFVARADDASALWHNPAGLARLDGSQLVLALNLVAFEQRYARAGAYADSGDPYPVVEHAGDPQAVPLLVAALRVGGWTVAAGLLAPQGYGARDYPALMDGGLPAPQRYDTITQRGLVALPSIGAGFRSGRWRAGVRLSWGVARAQSTSASHGIINDPEDPSFDVVSSLDADDRFVPAAGAGVQLDLGDGAELGVAWTSPIPVRARGTATSQLGPGVAAPPMPVAAGQERCGTAGGAPGVLSACIDFNLPQTATVGVRKAWRDRRGRERGDLELDVRWEDWSDGSVTRVEVDGLDATTGERVPAAYNRHGLVDSWSVRLGGSATRTRGGRALSVRGGVAWDSAAAPDSWRRLDLDGSARLTLAGGVGLRFGRVGLELGGARVIAPDQRVDDVAVGAGEPRQQPDVQLPLAPSDRQPYHPYNAGQYASGYWIASTGMTVSW